MGRRSGEIDPLDVRQSEPGAPRTGAVRTSATDDVVTETDDYVKVDAVDQEDDPEVVAARIQIEQTRAEMGETIDAIQERLQPDVLMQQAKDAARGAAQEKMDEVKGTIKEATIGKASDVMEAASGVVSAASDKVQGMMGSASDAIGGAGQRVQDAVGTGMGTTGDAMQSARTAVAGNSLVATIRRHPVPFALTTVGLGWLIMSIRSDASSSPAGYSYGGATVPSTQYAGGTGYAYAPAAPYGYRPGAEAYQSQESGGSGIADTAGQMAGKARDTLSQASAQAMDSVNQMGNQAVNTVSQVGNQAMSSMSQMGSQAKDNLTQMGGQATAKAQQVQSGFASLLQSNPLAVGVAVAGLGMLVGLAVPETEKENELLGEARDSLMDKAGQAVRDTAQNAVQSAVQETLGRS